MLLCFFQHSQVDATHLVASTQINVVKHSNGILEFSSPNYPNNYDNNLDLVKTINLRDATNSGFIIEID